MKAKYIGKTVDTSFGQYIVNLEYEYRGHRYTVYENRRKGSEPLAWQHANEQGRIDAMIETEEKQTASSNSEPVDLNEIWNLIGWN